MLTVGQVYDQINGFAPFETCESWDNSGLLMGSRKTPVKAALCALDLSRAVFEEALEKGANLIVTHHPILFDGRKNLCEDDVNGSLLCEMVRNHMALIAAHTNFDKAQGGVSDILAKWLDIGNVRPVEGDEEGYLRIGELGYPVELEKLVERAERQLRTKVRAYGNLHQKICKVAVCGGAGGEFARLAQAAGADAYVTGEMRYHDSFDLAQEGFATLQCGHDATERIAVGQLAGLVQDSAKANGEDIAVFTSERAGFLIG